MKKTLSLLLATVMLISVLPLYNTVSANETIINVSPSYGIIENYGNKTCFIVSTGGGEAMYNGLRNGSLSMRVTITDETDGYVYVIPRYAFDNPGLEIYGSNFFRLAVCEYGIVPYSDHAYTVALSVTDRYGNSCYYGSSSTGAFRNSGSPSFVENGAIIPDNIPHSHENTVVKPLYGTIENYKGKTLFIVGANAQTQNAAFYEGIRNKTLDLQVTVTDETEGITYTVSKYMFDNPSLEIYSSFFLRIAVCEYNIIPNAKHHYTVSLKAFSQGKLLFSGSSETGAFSYFNSDFNEDFKKNGAIIPENIPHDCTVSYREIEEPTVEEPGYSDDLNASGAIDIGDVTALLNYLSGFENSIGKSADPDMNFDGKINIADVTELLSLLSGKERVRLKLTENNSYTVVAIGNVSGGEITVPATHLGIPVVSVAASAFKDNQKIKSVTFSGETSISDSAFQGCTSLTDLRFMGKTVEIADSAFSDTALKNISYNGKRSEWIAQGALFPNTVVVAVTELDETEDVADPFDSISLAGATQITDISGYSSILRVKTSGELMFSPTLTELRQKVSAGASYNDYTVHLKFTDLTTNGIYPSVKVKGTGGRGGYVDIYLQGNEINCGFCPIADHDYSIDLIVTNNKTGKALCYGKYFATAPSDFKNSTYYKPSLNSGAALATPDNQYIKEEGSYIASYSVAKYGKLTGNTEQTVQSEANFSTVKAVPDSGYRFVFWSDGVTTPERNDLFGTDVIVTAHFAMDHGESEIANMYIYTDTGTPVLSKSYTHGTVVIQNASKNSYNIIATSRIKGRGNSSWNGGAPQDAYDSKNSYRLKFDEKLKLFGMGEKKNKDWVLNSNKFDLSGLRNWLVWTLANKMGTLPYVVESTWVQLYINDEYRGMYTVCEQVEAAGGRADVNDSLPEPDKGYLIEIDFRGDSDSDPYFYLDGYDNSVEFVIKSDISGRADLAFIKDYMQRCHDAIMSGSRAKMEELMDVPSLIDMYIIEELSKDVDVGKASFFLQKDAGGKLYFTAPWDFDFGFGTYGPGVSNAGLVSQNGNGCPWFSSLITRSWFRKAVLERMEELSGAFDETMTELLNKQNEMGHAADLNANFWNAYGNNYHIYVSGQVSGSLHSYEEHIFFLYNWTTTRWENIKNLMK